MTYEELEKKRIKLRNTYIIYYTLLITIVITITLLSKIAGFIIFGIALGILLIPSITKKQVKEYSLAFKDFFVKKSLTKIFTNLCYEPEKGIPKSLISSTGMMYMGDRYSSNDLVTGNYKDIRFTQSDVSIEKKETYRDGDGKTQTAYITIFEGRWMIFDFNKNFKRKVQVCQKGFKNNKINNFQKVEMESQEFNKNFKVYARQPIDAFYILTPKIMEKIRNLDKKNKGELLLCFTNNQLHVGINEYKDSFEPKNVFFKIDEEKINNAISTDIKKITMFIDELELNNDLFKRD